MSKIELVKSFYVSFETYSWVKKLFNWDSVSNGTYRLFSHILTTSAWRVKYSGTEFTPPIFHLPVMEY